MSGTTTGRVPRSPALAAGLRKAREDAPGSPGLREVERLLGWPHPKLQRYESGERAPGEDDVRAILDILGVTGRDREDLLALARGRDDAAWLAVTPAEHGRHLSALLRLEAAARSISVVAPTLVPDLLQTDAYARTVLAGEQHATPATPAAEDDVEIAVAVRLGRQNVLTGPHAPALTAVLWEPVLAAGVGGQAVMAGQLRRLLEAAALPNVTVRVVPTNGGWHPGLSGPATVLDTGQNAVVHVPGRAVGVYLHDPVDVARFAVDVDHALAAALPEHVSRQLIADHLARTT